MTQEHNMHSFSKNWRWPMTIIVLAVIALIGFDSHANRSMAPAGPTVVATIDLERVFNELDALAEAEAELERMANDLQSQSQQRAEKIKLMEEDLDTYVKGTKKYQDAVQAYSLASLELQAFTAYAKQKIDMRMTQAFRRIYASIKEAARLESEENGYDLVVVNDSIVALPESGDETEIKRQISARRLLYANTAIDITDDVIARMN